ncbi:MAG: hypothetical protein ACOC93_03110, partial [Planctomycetota bacterium]
LDQRLSRDPTRTLRLVEVRYEAVAGGENGGGRSNGGRRGRSSGSRYSYGEGEAEYGYGNSRDRRRSDEAPEPVAEMPDPLFPNDPTEDRADDTVFGFSVLLAVENDGVQTPGDEDEQANSN